jgi:ubiquinone/menaquinone biosynthesis C-methylase UbiE
MEGGAVDHSEGVRRAARTYASAADHYLRPALGFWDRHGAATVARLALRRGDRVLDLCCGAGASALAAARAVGPGGRVLAVDAAEPMVELVRRRAADAGLSHVDTLVADATRTGLGGGSFDAVVCVFGVFFVPDMPGFVAEMNRLVRPGGTIAVTTWGPGFVEPGSSIFWAAVRRVRPDLFRVFNPWDEITTEAALIDLFDRAVVPGAIAQAAASTQQLERPEDFWDVVLGSGYRGTFDALTDAEQVQVKDEVLREIRERGIVELRTDVVYSTAIRAATS